MTLTLTARQRGIFAQIAEGRSDDQIAEKLGLALNTVRADVNKALKANNCPTRTRLAVLIERERHEDQ